MSQLSFSCYSDIDLENAEKSKLLRKAFYVWLLSSTLELKTNWS